MIATQTIVVTDPAGRRRKVVAGQPVPFDLLDAYKAETGEQDDKEKRVAAAKRQAGPEKTKRLAAAEKDK